MATQSWSEVLSCSSDANFRAWGLALSNALTNLGIPKSADTGQVNWATVTAPSGSYPGFEIRYLNDSLHSTYPIYIKIEYGSSSTNTRPGLRFSFSRATDGAGGLVGTYPIPVTAGDFSTSNSGATQAWVASSCDASGFVIPAPDYQEMFWMVERSRDSSGNITPQGFSFLRRSISSIGGVNPVSHWTHNFQNNVMYAMVSPQVYYPTALHTGSTSLFDGSNVYLAPLYGWGAPDGLWYHKGVLGYAQADFSLYSTFSASRFGVSRTWKAMGNRGFGAHYMSTSTTADSYACLAIWWE